MWHFSSTKSNNDSPSTIRIMVFSLWIMWLFFLRSFKFWIYFWSNFLHHNDNTWNVFVGEIVICLWIYWITLALSSSSVLRNKGLRATWSRIFFPIFSFNILSITWRKNKGLTWVNIIWKKVNKFLNNVTKVSQFFIPS